MGAFCAGRDASAAVAGGAGGAVFGGVFRVGGAGPGIDAAGCVGNFLLRGRKGRSGARETELTTLPCVTPPPGRVPTVADAPAGTDPGALGGGAGVPPASHGVAFIFFFFGAATQSKNLPAVDVFLLSCDKG